MRASYKTALVLSIGLHFVILILFVSEFSHPFAERKIKQLKPMAKQGPIIHAVSVNQAEIEAEIKKIQTQRRIEHAKAIAKKQALEKAAKLAKLKREQELTQLQNLEKKIAEAKHAQELQKSEAEKALADTQKALKKAKSLASKAKQDANALKQLRVAEQQRLEQIKKAQAELEAKKKAEAELLKKKRELANQQRIENAQEQQLLHYQALIVEEIGHHWIVPRDVKKNLACKLEIILEEGGRVVSVTVLRSSGDPLLDRSAKLAVYKASPLPVPNDPELFEQFKVLHLTVRPENVITSA